MAKSDWEALVAEGSVTSTAPAPTGSGWRLAAGVIGIVALTLGFGFYWPLQRSSRLLADEYSKGSAATNSLGKKLTETEQRLAEVTAERDELAGQKRTSDGRLASRKEALDRLVAGLSQRLQQALDRKRISAELLEDRLQVQLLDAAMFTSAGDALSFGGQKLLCQIDAEARRQGQYRVVVRAFVNPAAPQGYESRWATPARQAGAVVDALTSRCGGSNAHLETAASVGTGDSDALRLEFYPLSGS